MRFAGVAVNMPAKGDRYRGTECQALGLKIGGLAGSRARDSPAAGTGALRRLRHDHNWMVVATFLPCCAAIGTVASVLETGARRASASGYLAQAAEMRPPFVSPARIWQ
jgi:hypothetical protein